MKPNSILDSIGNTPLINLEDIYVKCEYLNPSGSIKDRIANYIVEKAEKQGLLKKDYTIIEATSGNTGIAFSMVAAVKGYKMIACMPKGLSEERAGMMKAYGADVKYVKEDCFSCAIELAEKLGKKKKTYLPRQFENHWNVEEHEKHLAEEILDQVKKVDAFVAGVGTGGTLIGVGKRLKKEFPNMDLFALEPDECNLLFSSGIGALNIVDAHNVCKHHRIEGIGDGIIPKIISDNRDLIDGVITIKSKDAINACKHLSKKGFFVGPSSGANYLGAKFLKKKYKNVVTVFSDRGERYLSEHFY